MDDADAATDVTSASLILQAVGGITLDTSIDNLTANNTGGGSDIIIREANGINVLSAVNTGGNIQIMRANGLMNITNADAFGSFRRQHRDAAAAGDNLVVDGNRRADSFVSLIAGDDVTLQPSSDVRVDQQLRVHENRCGHG